MIPSLGGVDNGIISSTTSLTLAFGAPREVTNPSGKNSEVHLSGIHLTNHGQLKSVSQDKQLLFTIRTFNHLKNILSVTRIKKEL